MPDSFARFEIARSPFIDEEALKARFYQLTAGQHPDVVAGGGEAAEEGAFADLTVAYRVLANPRSRLRHLLELEAPELSFRGVAAPKAVEAFFLQGGQCKQELDAYLKKYRAASSALARALLLTEQYELQEKLEELLAGLTAERERGLALLPSLNEAWIRGERPIAELAELAQSLGYLDKWSAQLREGLLELQLLE